ncbi:sigma-70 family RNA polymerase sigma factor [Streptomyces sp. ID05-04B]|uniref:sigma-70 family RNA polymerase sigma factor n=1 Tax=Streptomyces sp. ID05-04B TaxID=3028661 RepID=UPI0029C2C53B|nr:sigma-70 family RNA polymerase sigma factor [Streptomyces sp. ID05-04B]MDX5562723.1 sigma-70 family RNA polymerase sigma factor [Streptomyces sp. ID05-04B]MDX5562786.1 sigma-70 family RNA polymerase sigma factor [Streptomyces sp. ID05-04B]
MTTPPEPPVPPGRPTTARPGRKLGPIIPNVGSAHRAWLDPMRGAYLASGLTLSELSARVSFAKSKISELLRGVGLYPRWEIVWMLAVELDMPNWPLYRLWRQAAFEAHKSSEWVDNCTDRTPIMTTTHTAPPLEHRAFRELAENHYMLFAQTFLDDDQRDIAVSDAFDILWLTWNDALASHDTRRFAWNVLRTTVMARTPHRDGRPELGVAAFDTVALRALTDPADRINQVAESLELFTAMSRLPPSQLDVMVLRRLCGFTPETVSALLGASLAAVRSDERHASRFLESVLCPPPTTEGNPP